MLLSLLLYDYCQGIMDKGLRANDFDQVKDEASTDSKDVQKAFGRVVC